MDLDNPIATKNLCGDLILSQLGFSKLPLFLFKIFEDFPAGVSFDLNGNMHFASIKKCIIRIIGKILCQYKRGSKEIFDLIINFDKENDSSCQKYKLLMEIINETNTIEEILKLISKATEVKINIVNFNKNKENYIIEIEKYTKSNEEMYTLLVTSTDIYLLYSQKYLDIEFPSVKLEKYSENTIVENNILESLKGIPITTIKASKFSGKKNSIIQKNDNNHKRSNDNDNGNDNNINNSKTE